MFPNGEMDWFQSLLRNKGGARAQLGLVNFLRRLHAPAVPSRRVFAVPRGRLSAGSRQDWGATDRQIWLLVPLGRNSFALGSPDYYQNVPGIPLIRRGSAGTRLRGDGTGGALGALGGEKGALGALGAPGAPPGAGRTQGGVFGCSTSASDAQRRRRH